MREENGAVVDPPVKRNAVPVDELPSIIPVDYHEFLVHCQTWISGMDIPLWLACWSDAGWGDAC